MVARDTGPPRKPMVPLWSSPARRGRRCSDDAGQALVETVALLPVYVLVALAMAQGAVAGYAAWSAAGAARIGARAEALGHDPAPAVAKELPGMLERGARVVAAAEDGDHAGRVTVRLRVPSVVPGLRFGTVRGLAQLPGQVS